MCGGRDRRCRMLAFDLAFRPIKKERGKKAPATPEGAIDAHAHILAPDVHKHCRPHSLPTLPLKDPSLTEGQRARAQERHNRMVDIQYDVEDSVEKMGAAGVAMHIRAVWNAIKLFGL